MNKCENCEYLKDSFENFVECIKLHRFVDWWYWNNEEIIDCLLMEKHNDSSTTDRKTKDVAAETDYKKYVNNN